MSSADLAIDYGTSNTVAVARGADGRSRQLLFDGSPLLPSAVYADPADGMRTGRDAVRSARLEPARYEPNPKRRIDESEVLLGEQAFAVTDLIAHTLRTVGAEAVRVTGGPVGRVVVTHPVAWGRVRRRILARACVEAGLPEPTLVAEPVAAAAYFAGLPDVRLAPGQAVTVYDLGAGTFDVSVLARGANGFESLGHQGLDDVGGLDLDGLVVAHAVAVVGRANPALWQRLTNPRDADDRRHHRLLWDDARFAKEALSRQHSATFPLALTGTDASITRAEFEALAHPMLARTVEVTAATIAQTGLAADRFAGVFLVGGGSRIPLVATLLHQRQRIAPTALEQPELAVAEGALAILGELPAVEAPTEPVGWSPAAAPVAAAPPVAAPPVVVAPAGEPARELSFVVPAVPQSPRDRAVPLWPSGAAPAVQAAPARSGAWVLAWWLLPVLVLVPIAVLGGFPLVVGLAILAVALIGMLVHALIRSRPN
jgi:molecular chaperone DnaK